jgi:hypothetical protein
MYKMILIYLAVPRTDGFCCPQQLLITYMICSSKSPVLSQSEFSSKTMSSFVINSIAESSQGISFVMKICQISSSILFLALSKIIDFPLLSSLGVT